VAVLVAVLVHVIIRVVVRAGVTAGASALGIELDSGLFQLVERSLSVPAVPRAATPFVALPGLRLGLDPAPHQAGVPRPSGPPRYSSTRRV
jgi:hypothetical protein